MNPLVFAEIAREVATIIRIAMESATPAQRERLVQWYIDDQERWRKFAEQFGKGEGGS